MNLEIGQWVSFKHKETADRYGHVLKVVSKPHLTGLKTMCGYEIAVVLVTCRSGGVIEANVKNLRYSVKADFDREIEVADQDMLDLEERRYNLFQAQKGALEIAC